MVKKTYKISIPELELKRSRLAKKIESIDLLISLLKSIDQVESLKPKPMVRSKHKMVRNKPSHPIHKKAYFVKPTTNEFGRRLREARLKAGLHQDQVARLAGFESGSFISSLETGYWKPNRKTQIALEKALKMK